uniref:helix-turn-helix transcriptional regulator n=1 Tax=Sphingomonas populi TaxID=2484750 RepID=UPI001E6106CC|nr:AlpA family phage regulatory protein [Sphingomonas populi]
MTNLPSDPTKQPGFSTAAASIIKDRRKDSLLRIKAVKARTGLSVATIYRRESDGSFPKRTAIGRRCVGWYESDIEDFVADPLNYRRP